MHASGHARISRRVLPMHLALQKAEPAYEGRSRNISGDRGVRQPKPRKVLRRREIRGQSPIASRLQSGDEFRHDGLQLDGVERPIPARIREMQGEGLRCRCLSRRSEVPARQPDPFGKQ